MEFLKWLFSKQDKNSPDILGRYPEYMQIRALPERRYIKTSRILAIFILINLGISMALAGLYTYLAERVDVSIAAPKAVNLFYVDAEQKRLRPAEHAQRAVYETQLMAESLLRQYIMDRHTIVWDNNVMGNKWGTNSFVWLLSADKTVYKPFIATAEREMGASRSQGFVRDVHLYEVTYLYENLWQAIFDTFDMPVPDPFNPMCDNCTDNSKECIGCKAEHAYNRNRYKVLIRTNFFHPKSIGNPLGFSIYSYQVLPMVVDDQSYWDTPRVLRPEI